MVDKISPELRKKTMQAIKGTNTKLEVMVTHELWKRGLRFRKNVSSLPGKPDIAIKKYKIVIFIDSCFWHGCEFHCRIPETNRDYWVKKISRNQKRDFQVTKYYLENNWNIIRIWEHQLKNNFEEEIKIIVEKIEMIRS